MNKIDEITDQILDRDGACRDVNFDYLDWGGAAAIIDSLLRMSSVATAVDGQGGRFEATAVSGIDVCEHAKATASCQLLLRDVGDLFSELTVSVFPDGNGAAFVELSFFPEAVLSTFTVQNLIAMLASLATLGKAHNFFLRYENVSWQVGQTGPGSGVIVTWHELQKAP